MPKARIVVNSRAAATADARHHIGRHGTRVGSHTLANVLAQTKRGGAVAAYGLAQGMDLPGSVAPFILRNVALLCGQRDVPRYAASAGLGTAVARSRS